MLKCNEKGCGGEVVLRELNETFWHLRDEGLELDGIRSEFLQDNSGRYECYDCDKVFSEEELTESETVN